MFVETCGIFPSFSAWGLSIYTFLPEKQSDLIRAAACIYNDPFL